MTWARPLVAPVSRRNLLAPPFLVSPVAVAEAVHDILPGVLDSPFGEPYEEERDAACLGCHSYKDDAMRQGWHPELGRLQLPPGLLAPPRVDCWVG